jgi:hypothetical protein
MARCRPTNRAPPAPVKRVEMVRNIEHLIWDLSPRVFSGGTSNCFLHNHVHEGNIMCAPEGKLLALSTG